MGRLARGRRCRLARGIAAITTIVTTIITAVITAIAATSSGALAAVLFLADGLTDIHEVLLVAFKDERLARVGEADVLAFGGHAAVNVGDEHLRQVVALADVDEAARVYDGSGRVALAFGFLDGDGGAVHVELAVADAVQPGPSEGILARGDTFGNLELKVGRALGVRVVAPQVACSVGGASTFDGMDDLPDRVLGRLHVLGDADLARAATVDSGALEGQSSLVALGVGVLPLGGVIDAFPLLAGEIGPVGFERAVVQAVWAIGMWLRHIHVGVDGAGGGHEGSDGRNDASREVHCRKSRCAEKVCIVVAEVMRGLLEVEQEQALFVLFRARKQRTRARRELEGSSQRERRPMKS